MLNKIERYISADLFKNKKIISGVALGGLVLYGIKKLFS
jgi:hypothetical protein